MYGGVMFRSVFSTSKQASVYLMAIVLLFSFGCKKKEQKKPGLYVPKPLAVRVEAVHINKMEKTIKYIGTIKPLKEVKIFSRVNGTLLQLMKKEGEEAVKGKVIAKMAVPDLNKRSQRVWHEIQKARMESAYHCSVGKNDKSLYNDKVISKFQMESTTLKCNLSKKGVKVAQASFGELQVVRKRSIEYAPISGRILKWFVQPGEHLFPGKPILLMGTRSHEVVVRVYEGDVKSSIKIGTKARITFPYEGKKFKNITLGVSRLTPMAIGPGRMVDVGISLPENFDKRVTYGQSIQVHFIVASREKAQSVPQRAIKTIGKTKVIFLAEKGKSKLIKVSLGLVNEGRVEIVTPELGKGLVVISNVESLKNGMDLYTVNKR
jgi:membrane fusion protein, multidrug efflux system